MSVVYDFIFFESEICMNYSRMMEVGCKGTLMILYYVSKTVLYGQNSVKQKKQIGYPIIVMGQSSLSTNNIL
jgi:hypothetical protein